MSLHVPHRVPIDLGGESIPASESESLIAHLGWIRQVARHLVADADRADDLAQEACVVALAHGPRDSRSLRGWLTAVMHNLVRQGSRGERRRGEREARAARAERVDATDELVARASLQRRIVGAVLDLEEPYRSTILLRFFEDLPPREIARRQGVPTTTVHSRLKRGLAHLRERLDDSRGAWFALLAPLASKNQSPLALTVGGVIVNAKVTLAVVSVAVLATVVAIAQLDDGGQAPVSRAAAVASDAPPPASSDSLSGELEGARAGAERVEIAAAGIRADSDDASVAASPALHRVRGRVIDSGGTAVAGLALAFEGGAETIAAHSRAGGSFEFETAAANGTVTAHDPRFATVRSGQYRASSSFEPIVIVAPAIEVGGIVFDPQRIPLRGARVSLALPDGFATRFGEILEATRVLEWPALSDENGRFTLGRVPQIEGALVRVLVDGYQPAFQPEPAFSDSNLAFILQRPAILTQGALRGRVLDPDGQGVAEARVAAGLTSTVTDASGEFAIDLSRAATADVVTAVKAGFRPARMERPEEARADLPGHTGWPDRIEMRLGGPPLSIEGRIVDPEGKPRGNLRVWVSDPTPFGLIGRVPAQNEALMAGAEVPRRGLEPDPNPPREDSDNETTNRNAGGPPTVCWFWVLADADGRFELGGLDDRRYTLRVLDKKTLQTFTSRPIQAGDHDARIEMPPPAVFAKLAGRISTVGDRPVAGVSVQLRTTGFEVHTRMFGGKLNAFEFYTGGETSTDAEGHFEFTDVPRDGVFFTLRSDQIVPCDWTLPGDADPEHLDVHVDVRCQLDVRLKAPMERADEIALLDGQGENVSLMEMNGESVHMNSSVPLVAGRSGVLSASSSARTLELRKNGKVVESLAIGLVPGEINLIEP